MPDSSLPPPHASGQEAAAVLQGGDAALFRPAEPAAAVPSHNAVARLAQCPGNHSSERAEEGPSPADLLEHEEDRIAPQVQPGTIGQDQ